MSNWQILGKQFKARGMLYFPLEKLGATVFGAPKFLITPTKSISDSTYHKPNLLHVEHFFISARWWQHKYFWNFYPEPWEAFPIFTNIFQMGWKWKPPHSQSLSALIFIHRLKARNGVSAVGDSGVSRRTQKHPKVTNFQCLLFVFYPSQNLHNLHLNHLDLSNLV